MRVSCAQFFAMSPAERESVTHIDMDLDRAQEQYVNGINKTTDIDR